MNLNSCLLPYWCQKLGWGILGLSAVLIVALVSIGSTAAHINAGSAIMLLPYLGFMLACLSREREEDEYISYIRMRTIIGLAAYLFVMKMADIFAKQWLMTHVDISTTGTIASVINFLSCTPTMILLYLLIFKTTIKVEQLKSRKNG